MRQPKKYGVVNFYFSQASSIKRCFIFLLTVWGVWISVHAQWLTQELTLRPGWNAVFLRVEPEPSDPDRLFASLPIESVWGWEPFQSSIQFLDDPKHLLPPNENWSLWLPPDHPQAFLTTLHNLHANRAYLIKVRQNVAPFTCRIKGHPRLFRYPWQPKRLNLCGLPVPAAKATFASFFRPCSAIPVLRSQGGEFRMILQDGQTAPIWNPAREPLSPGTAYWIRCKKATSYTGPLQISLDFGQFLLFLPSVPMRTITIKNLQDHPVEVVLRLRPSEPAPPSPKYVQNIGLVPLAYEEKIWSEKDLPQRVLHPLSSEIRKTLQPQQVWKPRLILLAREMKDDPPDTVRLGLLEITDQQTVKETIGILARIR